MSALLALIIMVMAYTTFLTMGAFILFQWGMIPLIIYALILVILTALVWPSKKGC